MYQGIYGPTNYSPFGLPNPCWPSANLPGQPRRNPNADFSSRSAYPCPPIPISDPFPYRNFRPVASQLLSATRRDMSYSGVPPESPREARRRLEASQRAMYGKIQVDKERKAAEQARAAKKTREERKAIAQARKESPKKPEAPEKPRTPGKPTTPKKSSAPKPKGIKKPPTPKAKHPPVDKGKEPERLATPRAVVGPSPIRSSSVTNLRAPSPSGDGPCMTRRPHKVDPDNGNTKNVKNTMPSQIVLGSTPIRVFSAMDLHSPSPFGDRSLMARRPRKVSFDDGYKRDEKENKRKGVKSN
ncbi:hypothetical protein PG988_011887 [Apiospora saccharicola]